VGLLERSQGGSRRSRAARTSTSSRSLIVFRADRLVATMTSGEEKKVRSLSMTAVSIWKAGKAPVLFSWAAADRSGPQLPPKSPS